jgi:hypothetical protein
MAAKKPTTLQEVSTLELARGIARFTARRDALMLALHVLFTQPHVEPALRAIQSLMGELEAGISRLERELVRRSKPRTKRPI